MNDDNKIKTTHPRLLITASNFRWKTINYWNNLPQHLRRETKLKTFKIGVKKWIKERMIPEPGPGEDNLTD